MPRYNGSVSIRGKLASELSSADIWDLINQRVPEDAFLEFKKEVLNPASARLDDEKVDLLADFVALANASGGHLIVGIKTLGDQAFEPAFMDLEKSKRIADSIRDSAIQYIRPGIVQLEVLPRPMNEDRSEWVVIAAIPDSEVKPHMVAYRDKPPRFTIRVGNRNRFMTYEEIKARFIGPQEDLMVRLSTEVESIKSLLGALGQAHSVEFRAIKSMVSELNQKLKG